jgi:hypothetical protein
MTRYRLRRLLCVLASGTILITSCGDRDDDTPPSPDGSAGSPGSGGSTTGGSGGVGGAGGAGGGAAGSAGSTDAGVDARVPCGDVTCNPNGTNRYCNPAGPNGPRCQACLTDEHCANNPQNRLFCDVAAGSCRSCLNDGHCTPPNRCIVGRTNNTCQLRCASDADCATASGTRRACNVTTMMCVECQNNTHCVGSAGGPVCVDDECEECGADTDCTTPGLPACVNNNCEGCRDNTQCAEPTPVCVTSGVNTCRECGSNADCATRPGGPACVMNVCLQCSGSVPCPPGNTCTMNTCVPVPVPDAGAPEGGGGGVDAAPEGGPSGEAGPPEAGGATDAADETGG